jgi:hypothetical protein
MAQVVRFRDRKTLIQRDAAASLAAQIREFPEDQLPAVARAAMLNQLHRLTHPDAEESIWPGGFVMLSRIQTAAVWEAIWSLPSIARRNQVRRAFDLVLLNVRTDTGEVMMSRAEFAAKIGTAPHNVSAVMGTLERMGVIRRERRRLAGVQGPGEAVYFAPPLLELMQGGKASKP